MIREGEQSPGRLRINESHRESGKPKVESRIGQGCTCWHRHPGTLTGLKTLIQRYADDDGDIINFQSLEIEPPIQPAISFWQQQLR